MGFESHDRTIERKIDPTRRAVTSMDDHVTVFEPGNPAHAEWQSVGLPAPDVEAMRIYRLKRLREQLRKADVAGALLYDPLNIRYATDTSNMQLWCTHNPVRYCYIPTEGPVTLFDFHNCEHLSADFPLVDESRHATSWAYFGAGDLAEERVKHWAAEIADLVKASGGGNNRILVDICQPAGIYELEKLGITSRVSMDFCELARKVKSADELKAMRRAVYTCEVAMAEMWRALRPGITENQLWSILHQVNIARGGEWIETRLLSSGPRTNPWFAECSDRAIEHGDIVGFDTDLVGPYGFCSDISRSWVTPGATPNNEQLWLYNTGMEQINTNIELFKPGVSFSEIAVKSYKMPPETLGNRYSAIAHGVGLCDEYPHIGFADEYKSGHAYDGILEEGMCLCVESCIGKEGGLEGIKLERQIVITANGHEVLDRFPMDLQPEL